MSESMQYTQKQRSMKWSVKIDGVPENVQLFKSIDPAWPCWGVSGVEKDTRWFSNKADAERFARTGESMNELSGH